MEAVLARSHGVRSRLAAGLPPGIGRRAAIAAEAVLLVTLVLMRSANDPQLLLPWAAAATVVSFLSPTSGLVLLVALAIFPDAYPGRNPRDLVDLPSTLLPGGPLPSFAVAALLGMAARMLLLRPRSLRPRSLPPMAAMGARVGPAAVLAVAFLVWVTLSLPLSLATLREVMEPQAVGRTQTVVFVQWAELIATWAPLPLAAWMAARGEYRPLYVGLAAHGVALIVTLTAFVSLTPYRDLPLAWLVETVQSMRARGPIGHPNGLGTSMAILAVAGLALFLRPPRIGDREKVLRLAGAAVGGLAAIAVLLTFSRGAMLAVVAGALLMLLRSGRRPFLAGAAGLLILAPVVLVLFFNVRFVGDVGRGLQGPSGNDQQRVRSVVAAVKLGIERPLTGHGFRTFHELAPLRGSPRPRVPHNDLARVFGELGLVGVALWGATWAAALWALWRGSTTLALAGLGAAAVALTAGMFNPLLLRYAVMVNAFLLIGYGYVAARSPPVVLPAGVGESVSPPMEGPRRCWCGCRTARCAARWGAGCRAARWGAGGVTASQVPSRRARAVLHRGCRVPHSNADGC